MLKSPLNDLEARLARFRRLGLAHLPTPLEHMTRLSAHLIALIRAGRWPADSDVVFIHTGGTPALFAYGETLGL